MSRFISRHVLFSLGTSGFDTWFIVLQDYCNDADALHFYKEEKNRLLDEQKSLYYVQKTIYSVMLNIIENNIQGFLRRYYPKYDFIPHT